VLSAYENQCAVCGCSIEVDKSLIALEAAHIKWHKASGPAVTSNGVSICVMHHELFGAGTFTVHPKELKAIVYEDLSGQGTQVHLGEFHEKPLRFIPMDERHKPNSRFLDWHVKEVFRAGAIA